MAFSLFSLEVIWSFISPLAQDLLRGGGKKLLARSRQITTKQDFYNLHVTLGDFDTQLRIFVDELSEFIAQAEERGNRIQLKWHYRSKLGKTGTNLKKSLDKLGDALEKVDPEFGIYAKNARSLLNLTLESEWSTLQEIQNELTQLRTSKSPVRYNPGASYGPGNAPNIPYPEIGEIDITPLKKQLRSAKMNLELVSRSVEELRAFIKEEIPLDLS